MPRYAALDIGSNTLRLLIAEGREGKYFFPLGLERSITRLGGNYSPTTGLDNKAMSRTLDALHFFAGFISKEGVEEIYAVATGVLREAKNGKDFLERIKHQTGIAPRLISGEEEARLMLKGVLYSLREKNYTQVIADIGGWTTEILWVEGGNPQKNCSVSLGTVALSEKYLTKDPTDDKELQELEKEIEKVLTTVLESFIKEKPGLAGSFSSLVGTAGTMTTLAAIHQKMIIYDPHKINGHRIPREALIEIYSRLCSLPLVERRKIAGLEKGREDLIIPGALIVLKLLDIFEMKTLIVMDSGLLEGILLDGISRQSRRFEKMPGNSLGGC